LKDIEEDHNKQDIAFPHKALNLMEKALIKADQMHAKTCYLDPNKCPK